MHILLIALVALAAVVGGASFVGHRRYVRRKAEGRIAEGETSPLAVVDVPTECCGQHAVCERDSLLAAISREVVYYDDEELDAYRGIPADAYDDAAAEAFRDVFYDLREVEVAGWVRSLQLRGVEIPDQIKDEVLLVVRERRFRPVGADGADTSTRKVGETL